MGSHMSKKVGETSGANPINNLQYSAELNSYEAACKLDADLQSFDTTLQARTNNVITSLAAGVEVRALSFDSLREVTECLLEMNQEVVKVISTQPTPNVVVSAGLSVDMEQKPVDKKKIKPKWLKI